MLDSVDVLVIGAGPVGLCAAMELVSRGIRLYLIAKRHLVKGHPLSHSPLHSITTKIGTPFHTQRK